MKKVVIGMSGGVDSSVAAILLQKQGYEVIGVTFVCTDDFDTSDATKVCKKLGIELHIIDYREIFKKEVIEKFITDYKNGITPNPCILCNRKIKFNYLYQAMEDLGADYLATGHYARIIDNKLYKSNDLTKDQTYFLCEVTKEQLSKTLFPLEGISKDVVRNIAEEYELENAHKKDSTDVCFINSKFKDYMKKHIISSKGEVVDIATNKIIGEHSGLNNYTIGQRKGLNIGGNSSRMFVVGKDVANNILYTSFNEDNEYLLSDAALIEDLNWLGNVKVNKCTAKFRYRQQENEVNLEFIDDTHVMVKYPQKIKAVTPGQACVFYNNDECLGGGIIKEVYKENCKISYL